MDDRAVMEGPERAQHRQCQGQRLRKVDRALHES